MGLIELMNRRRAAVQRRDAGIPETIAVDRRVEECGPSIGSITAFITSEDNSYRLNNLGDYNQGPAPEVATLWANSQRTQVVPDGYYKFLFDPPTGGFGTERVYYVLRGYILGWIDCASSGPGGL